MLVINLNQPKTSIAKITGHNCINAQSSYLPGNGEFPAISQRRQAINFLEAVVKMLRVTETGFDRHISNPFFRIQQVIPRMVEPYAQHLLMN